MLQSSSAFGEGTVIIEVGPHQKKYYTHKALLVRYSDYFRKALEGPWKEAQEGSFGSRMSTIACVSCQTTADFVSRP